MRRFVGGAGAFVLVAALTAGCGSSSGGAAGGGGKGHGPVEVYYAGSLVNMMEHDLGPKFAKASGYDYRGEGEGSKKLAAEIKAKTRRVDVFISAKPKTNDLLRGSRNGNWVSWYTTFAKAPLVIAYSKKSRFAEQLKSEPWYDVLTKPGIKIGRTDPKLDPKGQLTVQALGQAAKVYHRPGLDSKIEKTAKVFPEQDLVGRLESGQLDAGFFYTNEAKEQKLPTVGLGKVRLNATYTVSVLNRAPNRKGAAAFVQYLLGGKGTATLRRHGLTVLKPKTTGKTGAVPKSLRSLVG